MSKILTFLLFKNINATFHISLGVLVTETLWFDVSILSVFE